MNEREQDAEEASYQKIIRAIEENLLSELVRTSETLSNYAKRARASDMRGVILSDAWIDGMAVTMRQAHRRINEQSSSIDRLTAERDVAYAELSRVRYAIDRLSAERDAARAACELVASSLESSLGYAVGKPYFWDGPEGREIVQHTLRNAANNLREALGSEAGSLQTAVADVNAGRTRPAHELLEELRNESEENE